MTCDSLLATEVVTASGDIVTASATENPDLFWAVRGAGGGNFGVHTSFTYKVVPVRTSVFQLSWFGGDTAALVDAIMRMQLDWSRELGMRLDVRSPIADAALPAGPAEVNTVGLYWGPPAERGGVAGPGRADPGARMHGPSSG